MADQRNGKSAARTRVIIVMALAAAGVLIYLRAKKAKAAAAGDTSGVQAASPPASSGGVPTYSQSASGLYNGGYTPYTIINANPSNMTSTFPGASSVSTSIDGSGNPGGPYKSVTNVNGGSGSISNTIQPGATMQGG